MLPSARLFLNRDDIYENRRARQRAMWLYDDVLHDVKQSHELGQPAKLEPDLLRTPFPPYLRKNDQKLDAALTKELAEEWNLIAEVAEVYPRLLTWLSEGRASRYWNVFGAWTAVLRLTPGLRWVLWRVLFLPVARRAAWRPALYEAILQRQRQELNEGVDRDGFIMTVRGPGIPGLSAATEVAVITQTEERTQIREKIVNMTSGCIGISGLRGAGKTTLIRDICAHRYGTPDYRSPEDAIAPENYLPGLRLMVAAPLRFDSRDFLIHQYTCLCRAVLADVRFNPTSIFDIALGPVLLPRSIRPSALLGVVSGIALFVLAGDLAYQAHGGASLVPTWHAHTWEALGAIIAAITAMIALGWRTRRALIEIRQVNNLAIDADARLRRLHFQRTDTRSRSGALGGPMGTGVTLGTTKQFTEQMMTMPELIDDYRDFVERVVAGLQEKWQNTPRPGHPPSPNVAARLIIGIDALDQLDDPGQACQFLADLSATFGIPHCVHLISLSPGTLAAVDQRAVPLKMSSGGMFDEMAWIEPLRLNDAGKFLAQRVTGLPACFIALIYVLSGGLPRELVRVARVLFTPGFTPGQPQPSKPSPGYPLLVGLTVAAEHLIENEIRVLKQRTLASASSVDVSGMAELLKLLTTDGWPLGQPRCHALTRRNCDPVREVIDEVSGLWEGAAREGFADSDNKVAPYTAEVCNSFLASLYFLLTVRQLATAAPELLTKFAREAFARAPHGDDDGARGDLKADHRSDEAPILRDLARARLALGVNPYLADSLTSDARMTPCGPADPDFAPGIELRFLYPGPLAD
jgi:hypothetical protein